MCPPVQPPSPRAEIGFYWSDEQIFLFLDEYTHGVVRIPDNVLACSSPYLHQPSNLPEGIWFLLHLNEKKESVFGFWKPRGQACKIYSNSLINGWRSTLEYYEGKHPHAERTDWVMQEYSISYFQKELLCENNNPKEFTSLCRVFRCDWSDHINGTHTKESKNIIESGDISLRASVIPKTDNTSDQDSKSASKANTSPREIADLNCFLRGDFLELDDLEDPESHSSSSQNSSCPSKLSDEYFDSMALLRELEEGDVADTQGKYLSYRYSVATSVEPNDVVMVPPSSGSVFTGAASTYKNEPLTDECKLAHSTKRVVSETGDEGSSNLNGKKKENDAGRKKFRLKQFFCFT